MKQCFLYIIFLSSFVCLLNFKFEARAYTREEIKKIQEDLLNQKNELWKESIQRSYTSKPDETQEEANGEERLNEIVHEKCTESCTQICVKTCDANRSCRTVCETVQA